MLKTLCRGHMLLVILNGEEIFGTFHEKDFEKLNQKSLELKK